MALAIDSHLAVVPLVDELPSGFVFSYHAERSDTGYVYGSPTLAAGRSVRIFEFDGISNAADPTETDSAREIVHRFQSGAVVRILRRYPAVLTAWSISSNPEGYSDMVAQDTGSADLPWYAPMRSFSFNLRGMEVA